MSKEYQNSNPRVYTPHNRVTQVMKFIPVAQLKQADIYQAAGIYKDTRDMFISVTLAKTSFHIVALHITPVFYKENCMDRQYKVTDDIVLDDGPLRSNDI